MKKNNFLYALIVLLFMGTLNLSAYNKAAQSDSSVITFSLFYEAYKTNDYKFAYSKGWEVINKYVEKFLQYKPFDKMDDVITYLHDSLATTDEEKQMYTDTMLVLLDKAIATPDVKSQEKFIIRKPYIIEMWTDRPDEEKIAAYEEAFQKYPEAQSFYYDRLGMLYKNNDDGENGFKVKALQVYSNLSEKEPDNPLWPEKMKALADDPEQLADIMKTSWEFNKEDLGKAYAYAETCVKFQFYERAVEPLEFLTTKAPEVINYWRKLATVQGKLENNDKAIDAYKTLIELEPDNRENYYNLAIIYKNLGQLSVARSYLQKAANASQEPWDLPVYLEAQLYEQAARECGFEFEDKKVYLLSVETYEKAARIGGPNAAAARDRVRALSNSIPTQEEYFFRKIQNGQVLKIEGGCYGWIGRSVTARY